MGKERDFTRVAMLKKVDTGDTKRSCKNGIKVATKSETKCSHKNKAKKTAGLTNLSRLWAIRVIIIGFRKVVFVLDYFRGTL